MLSKKIEQYQLRPQHKLNNIYRPSHVKHTTTHNPTCYNLILYPILVLEKGRC